MVALPAGEVPSQAGPESPKTWDESPCQVKHSLVCKILARIPHYTTTHHTLTPLHLKNNKKKNSSTKTAKCTTRLSCMTIPLHNIAGGKLFIFVIDKAVNVTQSLGETCRGFWQERPGSVFSQLSENHGGLHIGPQRWPGKQSLALDNVYMEFRYSCQ